MNDKAARRKGRWRGALPVGPWNTPRHQCETRRRIVAHDCNLRRSRCQRACVRAHRP
jgi:hypothetical protein